MKISMEKAIELLKSQEKYAVPKDIMHEAEEMATYAMEKQVPKIRYNPDDEPNGHFYLVNGYMTCRKTGKDIRYPMISFDDLDFCPRCGQALVCSEAEK